MRFLVDMNLTPRWVEVLAKGGYDAVHWSSVGKPNASDHELMLFAQKHGYVILTHDLDFGAILATTHGKGPSVVQIRADDVGVCAIGGKVIGALRQAEDALKVGALLTIDLHRNRLRLLPLGESRT